VLSGAPRSSGWNGAVFALVPKYFPAATGTVTGLVGAMGGLGGFFPPLLLGVFRDLLGAVWPGFVLLALTSLVLARVNARLFLPEQEEAEMALPPGLARVAERLRAGGWATMLSWRPPHRANALLPELSSTPPPTPADSPGCAP
jgi:MFS family permease